MLPPLAAALAVLCAWVVAPAGADDLSGLALTEATGSAIRFAVTVPPATVVPDTGAAGARGITRVEIGGYESVSTPDDAGLPTRVVTLAVPPLGEVRVGGTGGEAETHEGVLLPGWDGLSPDGGPWSLPEAWQVPPPRARLLGVTWLRNQRVARVAICPAEYDAAARRLTLYRRVEITVQVEPAGELGAPAELRDPFEPVYQRVLLNYQQGRAWRRPATRRLLERAAVGPGGLGALAAVVPDTSVYFGRPWIKISIPTTGFYKITYGLVRNLSLFQGDTDTTAAPVDSLRLFTWPGVPVLPQDSYCDDCDYREVGMTVVDDGDGRFRSNDPDYIVFFAMGPSDWVSLYDATKPDTTFLNHPYATTNYYYLARATEALPVGGTRARIEIRDGTITNPELASSSPATFPARMHQEQDVVYNANATPLYPQDCTLFWEKWFWRAVKKGQGIEISVDVPGADTTQPVRLRALAWGLDYNSATRKSLKDHYLEVGFNGITFPTRPFDDRRPQLYDSTFTDLRTVGNTFRMSVPNLVDALNPSRTDITGLAWFDLFYARRFEPVGGRLDFDTPEGGNGDVVYRIGPFASATVPEIFDVTDACRPAQILVPADTVHYASRPDGYYLSFQASETTRRRYRVVPVDSIAKMTGGVANVPSMSEEQNLRSRAQRADYIVIYYDGVDGVGGFDAAAAALVEWRQQSLPLTGVAPPYEAKAVPVSALYDQFSGGRTDPAAIRNFLRAAYYNWNDGGTPRTPTFVTMLGDASYDYKNYKGLAETGQPGCLLPTFEDNFDDNSQIKTQYVTDDWLLNINDASGLPSSVVPDFFGGRIPAANAAAALAIVRDKVVAGERTNDLGEWRNRVMLIADDQWQGASPDKLRWVWTHLKQTAVLDESHTPVHMDRDYVYLHTYPTGPSYTKPGARADIKTGINEGVTLVNFVGHGSPTNLADEKVLLDSDVGTLVNSPRFPVFIAASCDVGKFSDPNVQSLGELLMTRVAGGATGMISATEMALSSSNATLNRQIYDALFARDTVSYQYHVPISRALLTGKRVGSTNGQKYQLMGDAATSVMLPRLWVELALADSAGDPVSEVRRGQKLRFTGQVLDYPGGTAVSLEGAAAILIEDSQPRDSVQFYEVTSDRTVYSDSAGYYFRAGSIYRGDVGVTGGQFHGSFVVPLEARDGLRARIRAYVQGRVPGEEQETDGVGAVRTSVVAGEPAAGDASGPRIGLSFVGGSTTVRPDAVLTVDLYDESGILTTDHAAQNGIIVTVDGNTTTRADITESFRYAADSYQSGRASYALPDLATGPHTVTVSAADNLAAGLSAAAHRSRASLDFIVEEEPTLRISHAYLFPNPTESAVGRGGGQFVVDAPGDSVNVLLRIYTSSGRLIRTLKAFGGMGQTQLPWDGLDEEGQPLANGVYFFRVHVNPRDEDGTSNPMQKDDADGKFVIVNRI